MSFILDALKKSELERQRQTIPGLMDAGPLERRPRFPLWAVALVVLLGVNLAVLLIVLLRSTPSSTHAVPGITPPLASTPASPPRGASSPGTSSPGTSSPVASAPAASAPTVSVPAEAQATPAPRAVESPPAAPPAHAATHFSPMDAAPVYAPEIPADSDAAAASAGSERTSEASGAAALGRTDAAPGSASPARTARARDPVLTADEDKADEEVLPRIGEIDLSGQPALPDLHLDVHVFAAKPADRFVYINMRKYREGAALADGLTLERIRRDGVVLNYHGLRFLLPRQQ
jgi:general secretion pathway protein B